MNFFILIIFLQIILESLPVSSSGHLVLLSKLAALNFPESRFVEQIDYFLHGPTIVILMVVFYKQWFFPVSRLVKGFFNKVWILKQVSSLRIKLRRTQKDDKEESGLFTVYGWTRFLNCGKKFLRIVIPGLIRDLFSRLSRFISFFYLNNTIKIFVGARKRSRIKPGMTNESPIVCSTDNKVFSFTSYKRLFKIFFKIIKLIFVANLITTAIWFLVKTFLEKQSWFMSDITLLFGFCVTAAFLFSLRTGSEKGSKTKLKREQTCHPRHRSGIHVLVNFLLRKWKILITGSPIGVEDDKSSIIFYRINKSLFNFGHPQNNISKFIILGLVQGLALLPGISRFASVYATARLLKIPTRRAFEITFLLQFPLIVAGFFLGFYKMSRVPGWYNIFSLPVVLSIIVATIVSVFVLFWCKRLARDKKLWRFSFYMFFPISILILIFVF